MKNSTHKVSVMLCRWLACTIVLVGLWTSNTMAITYFSKAIATDFNDVNTWGINGDGTGASPGAITNADDYTIANGSALSLTGSVSVRTLTINTGSLTIGANTLTVEIAAQNNATLTISATGTLTVSGGTLILNGNMAMATGGNLAQSGGAIIVDGNSGVVGTSVATGTHHVNFLTSTLAQLSFTGGTFTIVDPHLGAAAADRVLNISGTAVGAFVASTSHTFRFGDGVSTNPGGNVLGFQMQPWVSTTGLKFGNVEFNGATGTNRIFTLLSSFGSLVVGGNITVNTGGDLRHTGTAANAAVYCNGNFTVNGTFTSLGMVRFENGIHTGSTTIGVSASTNAQTISGTGVFRNNATTPTANFLNLIINNSSAGGVTFANANTLLSGANSGTVSGTLTFTNGVINTGGNVFRLGITGSTGSITHTAGGFGSGSVLSKYITSGGTGTAVTSGAVPAANGIGTYPFVNGNPIAGMQSRNFTYVRVATGAVAGFLNIAYTEGAGGVTTIAPVLDGAYSIDRQSTANWALSAAGGFGAGTGNYSFGVSGQGIYVAANTNGRLMLAAAPAAGAHQAGTTLPHVQRITIPGGSALNTYYIGVNNADMVQPCSSADGGVIAPSTASICSGATYAMASTGFSTGTGTIYQWKLSKTSGSGYVNVTGGTGGTTTSHTTPILPAGTYYYVLETTCPSFGTDLSNELTLTVNPLQTVSIAPATATICAGQSVQLTANCETYSVTGTLSQAQEVPPTGSPATGTVTGTYNAVTKVLTMNVIFSGLTSNSTAAHIHGPAPAGVNAGVLIDLPSTISFPVGVTQGSPSGNITLTAVQETYLFTSMLYVNIHTSTFPGGEIRAQLSPTPNACGSVTYSWNNAGTLDNATIQNPTATPPSTTTYTVITTGAGACTGTASRIVNVNPAPGSPTANATPSSACIGGTVNLSSSATVTGYVMNSSCGTGFVDISGIGTPIMSGAALDDDEANITLPFTFNFNGTNYTTARVGFNGAMVFGATTLDVTHLNVCLPATNLGTAGAPGIAVFWDDMDAFNASASVRTILIGSVYYIQWTNAMHYNGAAGTPSAVSYQIQLEQTTNKITLVYADVDFGNASFNGGLSATVGINFSASSAMQYSCNTASLTTGQCISFTPATPAYSWAGPNAFSSSQQNPVLNNVQAADAGTYTVTFTNNASGCTATASTAITVSSPPTVTINSVTDASCFGVPDGAIDVGISGGTAPYSSTWTGPSFGVTVVNKNSSHPYFNVGSAVGFEIDGVQGREMTLVRGVTYSFNINNPGHPMYISTDLDGAGLGEVTDGVTGSQTDFGTLTFTPNSNHPNLLYYQCFNHQNMGWEINIVDPPAPAAYSVISAPKTAAHPYFGVGSANGYKIDGVEGPAFTMIRGTTYTFNINAPGHPFYISTDAAGAGAGEVLTGVTGSQTAFGTLTFTPDATHPSLLYYQCYAHPNMGWQLNIVDPPAATTQSAIVVTKTPAHPYFGVGSALGYELNGVEGPELTLVRGTTYTFNINAPGHPLYISTDAVGASVGEVTNGVTGSQTDFGTMTFTPDNSHPALLYYQCFNHANMGYKLNIINPPLIEDLTDLHAGTYTIVVTDANGCTGTNSATVNEPPATIFYADADGDTYGDEGVTAPGCTAPTGFVSAGGDCNDGDPGINPGAAEICGNATDENCDGLAETVAPAQPSVISGAPSDVCPPALGIVLSVVNDPNATSYLWFNVGAGSGITYNPPSATNTQTVDLGATVNTTYSIRVTASNACGTSPYRGVSIRRAVSTPAAVTGPSTVCPNGTYGYSTGAVTGATSYLWSGPAGTLFDGANPTPYTTVSNSVTATLDGSFTSGAIGVAAQVGCFTSTVKTLAISTSAPAIGLITGNAVVCPGSTHTYSVVGNAAVASYSWTLPAGATGTSNTNSINVTYGATVPSANVCVTGTSVCGVLTAPRCKSVAPGIPSQPAGITGPTNGLCNQTVNYTCPAQGGVTYTWTGPPGSVINSGQGTNGISITFPTFSDSPAKTVCVVASNACGSAAPRCITVRGAPNTPAAITASPASWCANTSGIVFTANLTGLTGSYTLGWTYPPPSVATYVIGGGNTPSLTLDWISGSGNVAVTASNACGSGTRNVVFASTCREGEETIAPVSEALNVYPNPTSGNIHIEFSSTAKGNANVTVMDVSGRIVTTQDMPVTEGMNQTQLDLGKIAKGIYMLNVNTGSGTQKVKIVVE